MSKVIIAILLCISIFLICLAGYINDDDVVSMILTFASFLVLLKIVIAIYVLIFKKR